MAALARSGQQPVFEPSSRPSCWAPVGKIACEVPGVTYTNNCIWLLDALRRLAPAGRSPQRNVPYPQDRQRLRARTAGPPAHSLNLHRFRYRSGYGGAFHVLSRPAGRRCPRRMGGMVGNPSTAGDEEPYFCPRKLPVPFGVAEARSGVRSRPVTRRRFEAALSAAMPGMLVGAGLLFTFVGLAYALAEAGDVVAGADTVKRQEGVLSSSPQCQVRACRLLHLVPQRSISPC